MPVGHDLGSIAFRGENGQFIDWQVAISMWRHVLAIGRRPDRLRDFLRDGPASLGFEIRQAKRRAWRAFGLRAPGPRGFFFAGFFRPVQPLSPRPRFMVNRVKVAAGKQPEVAPGGASKIFFSN
ncbi:MAG TPA: hypothetical protein VJV79_21355 [Polyangiaceae bacterium]|nr:hypothetical protein [Polyangiaceae bacterium]